MSSETLDFFEQWEPKHKYWEEQLTSVEKVLEDFRRELNGDIERYEHDAPTLSLHWYTPNNHLDASLSILLGSSLKIWGMAWKDYDEKRERHLRDKWIEREITEVFNQENLRSTFKDVVYELNLLQEKDLVQTVAIGSIPRFGKDTK